MRTLNDIPPCLQPPPSEDNWTPLRGLAKGSVCTFIVALILSLLLCLPAYFAPGATTHWLLSPALSFAVTWMLFAVMHRAAGQTGSLPTFIVVLLGVLVISSKHVLFATHGFLTPNGLITGWRWLHPLTILSTNLFGWLGILAGTLMCKDGDSILLDAADFLMIPIFGGRRN